MKSIASIGTSLPLPTAWPSRVNICNIVVTSRRSPGAYSNLGEKCVDKKIHASANAVEIESDSLRPPIFQEVWIAPSPSRLIKDGRAFQEEHRIRGYEVSPDQRTTMINIANLLQEVASNHAVAMWGRSAEGFATDPDLSDKGLIFVMTRMQIQMDVYPCWGDMVRIETWFQEAGKIGAQRDWTITDPITGQLLGRATSTWVMINMHTRRLSKLPENIRTRLGWFQSQPPANAILPEYTRLKLPEVDVDSAGKGPSQIARRSDIDMNGHINNVTYLAWVLETIPTDVYADAHLYQMEVDFKAECMSGDFVEALVEKAELPEVSKSNGAGPDALSFVHMLRRCEGDQCTELVRARTTWRDRK